ncbi:MAG TPA: hypothetical protein VLW85_20440 [Myxococcales bacterium]|nr:hypothetical protein [Myxococcales bacterium]
MKTLVIWYSRTGTTRTLGRWIAAAAGAEIEEIDDGDARLGLWGYLRSGNEATFHRRVELNPPKFDPRDFDLVIVGTPVWRLSMSSPVRTWLEEWGRALPRVAFFCTMDRFGSARVFRQMQRACGRVPEGTFARRRAEMITAELPEQVRHFVARLQAQGGLPRQAAVT